MTAPTAVVFDIGNVLIQWDPRNLYSTIFDGDDLLMDSFLEEVCTPAWNREMDGGLPWAEGVARLSREFPECAELIRAFDERWMEMVPGEISGAPELLEELHERGVPLYVISNFSADKFRQTKERFAFFSLFADIVISADVGFLKPDPAIYRLFCERNAIPPESALFVDDLADNCAGAQAAGMSAHPFRGVGALRRELTRLGLL